MATTTNYGWTTPDDTALVKDGAAAIRTLGSSIDTTTKNLNPQTTTGAIAYRSATSNVNTSLAIGTAGQVLTVNSGATAPEWATPAASGAYTQLATGNLSGSSVSITSISGTYKDLLLTIESFYGSLDFDVKVRVNSSSANYRNFYNRIIDATYGDGYGASDMFVVLEAIDNSDGDNYARIQFYDYANASIYKRATAEAYYLGSNTGRYTVSSEGLWRDVSAITSIQITLDQGTWSGGTYTLYGVK